MAIVKASNTLWVINPADNGNTLELGTGSAGTFTGIMVVQFNPDLLWNGSIQVLARLTGPAAETANLPMVPIPYRRVTVNNVASDRTLVSDTLLISSAYKIEIPSNRDSIGFLVSCLSGSCTYVCAPLQGQSA